MDAKKLEQLAREAGMEKWLFEPEFSSPDRDSVHIDELAIFADLVLEEVALKLEDIDALCAEEVRAMKGKD